MTLETPLENIVAAHSGFQGFQHNETLETAKTQATTSGFQGFQGFQQKTMPMFDCHQPPPEPSGEASSTPPGLDYEALGDLRPCLACANLGYRGQCRAAAQGKLPGTARLYRPVETLPRRCEGYLPSQDDPDQRPGLERWPGLEHPAMKSLAPWPKPKEE